MTPRIRSLIIGGLSVLSLAVRGDDPNLGAGSGYSGSAEARQIYQIASSLVFPIVIAADGDSPKAGYGTGFVVRKTGLLATNFHVVERSVLEPRRLAARSAARYMATLLGEEVGATVGYRTRLDTKVGPRTRIEVVTEGILTRLLQDDAALSDYGIVIFDEFHERSLQADLGLALVRECQQLLRDDLRLLVMSATLDAAAMGRVLGADFSAERNVLACSGQAFPVEVRYRPPGRTPLQEHLAAVVREMLATEDGSLLVFLPGEGEIRRLAAALEGTLPPAVQLAPLYDVATGLAYEARENRVLSMSVGGQFAVDRIGRPEWERFAEQNRLDGQAVVRRALQMAETVPDAMREALDEVDDWDGTVGELRRRLIPAVDAHMSQVTRALA